MPIILHDEIPFLNDVAFEPAGACADDRLVRMFAEAEHLEIFADDGVDAAEELLAQGRASIACGRRGTVRQRHQEKRRAVRAFVASFKRHCGDEPGIALVLQPQGSGARTVTVLVSMGELLEFRAALAGFSLDDGAALA